MADQRFNVNNQRFGDYGPYLDGPEQGHNFHSERMNDHQGGRDRYRQSFDGVDYERDRNSRHRRSRSRSRERERRRDRESERPGSRSSRGDSTDRQRPRSSHSSRTDRDGYRANDREHGRDEFDRGSNRSSSDVRRKSSKSEPDWRSKLTSIRDAHFNRNKQAPVAAQNTFKNDGSFLEMFKKKMAAQAEDASPSSLTPNSLVLASSSIQFSEGISLPPLTATPLLGVQHQEPQSSSSVATVDDQDVDGVPMTTHKPVPVPVSVGKRRLAKPLKTGIVIRKPPEPAEDEADQEKLEAWSRYLQELQRYKTANCSDDDASRPLVK